MLKHGFRDMLCRSSGLALASIVTGLDEHSRAVMAATVEARLSRAMASGGNTILRPLARAYLSSIGFLLEACAAVCAYRQAGDGEAVAASLKSLCDEYTNERGEPALLILALDRCTAPARARSRPAAGAGDAPVAPEAVADTAPADGLLLCGLRAIVAPGSLPRSLVAFLDDAAGQGRAFWFEAFSIYLAWELKTAAPLRFALFPELQSSDRAVASHSEQFLQGLFADARQRTAALEARMADGSLAAAPAIPGAATGEAWAQTSPCRITFAEHAAACASRLAEHYGLDRARLARAAGVVAATCKVPWVGATELMSAAEAARRLHSSLDSDSMIEVLGEQSSRARELARGADLAALDSLLGAQQAQWQPTHPARQAVGSLRADLALSEARYKDAIQHLLGCLEQEWGRGSSTLARTAGHLGWALLLDGRRDRRLLEHAEEFTGRLRSALSPVSAELTMATAMIVAARAGPGAEPARAAEIAELLRASLDLDAADAPDEAIALDARLALGTMAWNAAQRPGAGTERLPALAADAWSRALVSAGSAADPLLRAEAARRCADASLRCDVQDKSNGWAETAALAAGIGLHGLSVSDLPPEAAGAHDLLIETLARAQAHLGRSRRSRHWLPKAVAAYQHLLRSATGVKKADALIQIGQLQLLLGKLEPADLDVLHAALQSADALLASVAAKDQWRTSCGLLTRCECLLEIGRREARQASLLECLEIANAMSRDLATRRLIVNGLQILATGAGAASLLGRAGESQRLFQEARGLAELANSAWWRIELDKRMRTPAAPPVPPDSDM